MDGLDFDRLTRRFGRAVSRRRLGRLLAALGPAAALGLGAGVEAGKKRKKKKKPRCPRTANPHWCAKARTCVPACPPGKRFNKASCRCECTPRSCCACYNAANPFCSAAFSSVDACRTACQDANPGTHSWEFYTGAFAGETWTSICSAAGRCVEICEPDDCAGKDACKGNPGSCAVGGLQCFQPLGGGPTRCGRPTEATSCGCASHQQCRNQHGPTAFCVQITGDACTCGGKTTFCATQLGGA